MDPRVIWAGRSGRSSQICDIWVLELNLRPPPNSRSYLTSKRPKNRFCRHFRAWATLPPQPKKPRYPHTKRHTRPYCGCAERAYVQNAQNFHSWGVLGMRLPCVVYIQVHRQANAQLLTHIFITQVLHIQRMLGVLTEAFRVHPRATLHLPIVNSRDLTWRYFLQQQYQ